MTLKYTNTPPGTIQYSRTQKTRYSLAPKGIQRPQMAQTPPEVIQPLSEWTKSTQPTGCIAVSWWPSSLRGRFGLFMKLRMIRNLILGRWQSLLLVSWALAWWSWGGEEGWIWRISWGCFRPNFLVSALYRDCTPWGWSQSRSDIICGGRRWVSSTVGLS